MSQAWELRLAPSTKLVLLALCDWSNDSGLCFPSVPTIARRTCISKRQCQRIMSDLATCGFIAVIANQQGGAQSRRYQINLRKLAGERPSDPGDNLSPVASVSSRPVTNVAGTDDAHVTRTTTDRHIDPPLQGDVPSTALDWTFLTVLTDEDRVVVLKLLMKAEQQLHQDLLDELAGAHRAKTIRAQWPGWFRGLVDRASKGEFTPHHALTIRLDRRRRAREADDREKRRRDIERQNDPERRARGIEAMAAAFNACLKLAD